MAVHSAYKSWARYNPGIVRTALDLEMLVTYIKESPDYPEEYFHSGRQRTHIKLMIKPERQRWKELATQKKTAVNLLNCVCMDWSSFISKFSFCAHCTQMNKVTGKQAGEKKRNHLKNERNESEWDKREKTKIIQNSTCDKVLKQVVRTSNQRCGRLN